jgi:hypothetical protein
VNACSPCPCTTATAAVAVEVADREAERAARVVRRRRRGEREHAGAIVDQQAIVAERADEQIGIAVGIDVEERGDVVVGARVRRAGEPGRRLVGEVTGAIVDQQDLAQVGAVVDGHEIEIAVAVDVHRLELVVVRQRR